ncbi:hypothetical protein ACFV3R_33695 [Streptomyces sp. NPDC059740]|uniref:hypothetical protein n=1 Tax=Streptomyces sp. NPDC059740 TaxID=3346926 RepID=UPI00364667F8
MPLHVLPAPAPALRSVQTALHSPTATQDVRTPALRSHDTPPACELPLPVHVLTGISRPGPLRTRLTGWRFMLRAQERTVAAAEAMLTADGWTFSHFCEGPYVASTERALHQAALVRGDYRPRLLSVPELYMLTLWLRRQEPQAPDGDPGAGAAAGVWDEAAGTLPAPADLLVPLAPAPPGIVAHRPHRVGDLLPRLTRRLAPAPLLSGRA